MPLRYLSLFSGIGGFELGIQNIFPDAVCIGWSEIDTHAQKVYQQRFPRHPFLGPIDRVRGHPSVDLVVGGPPCNQLSRQRNNPVSRSTKFAMMHQFARIVRECGPGTDWICENVASMSRIDREYVSSLLGYYPIEIDAANFVPQKRVRLFWTTLPVPREIPRRRDKQVLQCLLSAGRVRSLDAENSTSFLSWKQKYRGTRHQTRYFRVFESRDDVAPTITTQGKNFFMYDHRLKRHRRLDPTEMELFQGLPARWTDGLTKTARQKVIGKAVPPQIISWMMEFY